MRQIPMSAIVVRKAWSRNRRLALMNSSLTLDLARQLAEKWSTAAGQGRQPGSQDGLRYNSV
jgi:hypothetical protein